MFRGWQKKGRRTPNAVYVKLLFEHFLGRNIEPQTLAALATRLDQGLDLRELIDGIISSEEYASKNPRKSAIARTGQPEIWSPTNRSSVANADKFDIEHILLIKADHVGDFIMAIDSFLLFRETFPSALITLLCGPWNEPLARALDIFDNIQTVNVFPAGCDGFRLPFDGDIFSKISGACFDLAVDLRVVPDSRVMLDHVDARFKCGYASNACQSRLAVELPYPSIVHSDSLALNHRMMTLSLANAVGTFFRRDVAFRGSALRAKLVGSAKIDPAIRQGRKLVAINPFSSRAIKNWPIHNFLSLAGWLTSEMGASVVLLGTKAEADSVPELADKCAALGTRSLVGETSLVEAITLISEADLFVGNDSGLTHVAARLDVPSLAIFSGYVPIETCAPYGQNVTIVHAPVECAPCGLSNLDHCPANHKCIGAIDLEYVQSRVREKLEANRVVPG